MAALQSPKLSVGVRVPGGSPININCHDEKEGFKLTIYKVKFVDTDGKEFVREFDNLSPAMEWAKTLTEFVTISGGEFDIVGKFGVDSVESNILPNGLTYEWKKRRI